MVNRRVSTINKRIANLEEELIKLKQDKEALLNATTIGERINKCMLLRNYTQDKLAKVIGITRQEVGNIVNDKVKCSAVVIGKIAQEFGVSCDYLILGETQ